MSKVAIAGNVSGTGTVILAAPNTDSDYTITLPGGISTLADGATITPDFGSNSTFTVTLGGSRTMANPTNMVAGQSGSIFIIQDGTGGRTLAWGSYWDFIGGSAPSLSTAPGAVDRVDFIVRSAGSIHTVFTANYS